MCLGEIVRLDTVTETCGMAHLGERELSISLVTLDEPVTAGDWVVVHSGFALQRLDPHEAADALSLRTGEPPQPRTTTPSPDSRTPDNPEAPTQEQQP